MSGAPTILRGFTTWPIKKSVNLNHDDKFYLFLARALWIGILSVAASAVLESVEWQGPWETLRGVISHLIGGLGEAFLIAYVVAVAVEPYMQKWYATQVNKAMWWAVHREGLPDGARRSIEELASSAEIFRSVQWVLYFDWADATRQQLEVKLKAICRGVNVDEPNLHPPMGLWLAESAPPYQSHYVRWTIDIPDVNGSPWSIEEDDMRSVERRERLPAEYYPDHVYVPIGGHYFIEKEAVVYPGNSMIPLRIRCITERIEYRIEGPAARTLEFTLKHPDAIGTPEIRGFSGNQRYVSMASPRGACSFPGHVALLSWRPAAPPP